MKKLRRIAVVTVTLLICFIFVPAAFAHPLGNFTINHYAGLQVTSEAVAIDLVIDMAEIPAFQEITAFDANGNGLADASEASARPFPFASNAVISSKAGISAMSITKSIATASCYQQTRIRLTVNCPVGAQMRPGRK